MHCPHMREDFCPECAERAEQEAIRNDQVAAMQAALSPGNLSDAEAKAVLAVIAPHSNRMRAAQAAARVLYARWDRYGPMARRGCLTEADAVVCAARGNGE